MEIYIVRHGDAIDRNDPQITSDAMRWLTDEGRDEVAVSARLLQKLGVRPDLVMTSPMVRARQTAEIISDRIGPAGGPVTSDDLVYGGSLAGVLEDILQHGKPKSVVLAGHMPSVGALVGYLAWARPEAGVPFRTAEVARVDLPDDALEAGFGDLRWLIPPKIARKLLGGG
ncbi:MAG TPA: phosphohistidine phosphatase SixA [Thermomicrobiales bacterium]|nr:phosphohistidine phosphatase SixA [Thermomicrobiales bacterium]